MLTLTDRDAAHLSTALSALLAPLDYAHDRAWRRAVNRSLKPLFRADQVSFMVPANGKPDFFSEDYDEVTAQTYPEEIAPVASRYAFWSRCRRFPVGNRSMLWGRHVDAYFKSAYWHEFAKPRRAYDALLVTASLGPAAFRGYENAAQFMFHHASPHASSFGDRGLGLGRLLLPALKTGATAYLHLAAVREAFARLVDELDSALLLFGRDGELLHRNRRLNVVLERDRQGVLVEAAAAALVARCACTPFGRGSDALGEAACVRSVRTGTCTYTLRAIRVDAEVTGHRSAVVVLVEGRAGRLPTREAIQERHGLTRQQARVALLLAERRTNEEVAEALCISPHTAHRHTTAVLAGLGLSSRRDVRDHLLCY
ncbi:MAG: helix-turn-helix transcriptional regulator [Rhodothermales bacterium]